MVINALTQNDGGSDVGLTRKSLAPAQSAAATIHNVSIHRFGRSDRPNQTTVAMSAPINVDPTSSHRRIKIRHTHPDQGGLSSQLHFCSPDVRATAQQISRHVDDDVQFRLRDHVSAGVHFRQ